MEKNTKDDGKDIMEDLPKTPSTKTIVVDLTEVPLSNEKRSLDQYKDDLKRNQSLMEKLQQILSSIINEEETFCSVFDHKGSFIKILNSDIRQLMPETWLRTNVMDGILYLLRKADINLHPVVEDQTYFFQTTVTSQILGWDGKTKILYQENDPALNIFLRKKIVLTANMDDKHWIAFKVNIDHQKNSINIIVQDSNSQDTTNYRNKIKKMIRKISKFMKFEYNRIYKGHVKVFDNIVFEVPDWEYDVNHPGQPNGYDCGIFVLIGLLYDLLNMEHDFDKLGSDFLRYNILMFIINNNIILRKPILQGPEHVKEIMTGKIIAKQESFW